MSTRRITHANTTALYLIAVVVVVVAFLLLGGGTWVKEMTHGSRSIGLTNWNWATIPVCLGLGFLLGLIFSRRRW